MAATAQQAAVRLARLGHGGVRLSQLMALRIDLFDRETIRALTLRHPVEVRPPAQALTLIATELDQTLDAVLPVWTAGATGSNPLCWTAFGRRADGRDVLLRVALPERAPDSAAIDAAIAIVTPLLRPGVDREHAATSLARDLHRWIAADLDIPGQRRRMLAWRRRALTRTGIVVPRIATPAAAHVIGVTPLAGLPLPQVEQLVARNDVAALDWHDIDAPTAAQRLIEAGLERLFIHHEAPVDPRPASLLILPESRIGLGDLGAAEPLSRALQQALPRFVRALLSGDPARLSSEAVALFEAGPVADAAAYARHVTTLERRMRDQRDGTWFERALADGLAAAGMCGFRVPADLLAALRWMTALAASVCRLDPAVDLAAITQRFMMRRSIETLFEAPDSHAIAVGLLDEIEPLATLPRRLDQLLSQATAPQYRVPVDLREPPADRAVRRDQRRLIGVAIFWVGCAVLLLVPHPAADRWPAWASTALTATLWSLAALSATGFVQLWRRSA